MGEYTPTEYVVDFGDYRSSRFVELSMALIEHNGAKLHERIVRCRDCKYCGMDETKYAGLGCVKFSFGSCHKDIPFGDGYCAWGERRE